MVYSIDAAHESREAVTTIVEFCNPFIWEGTSGEPDTAKMRCIKAKVTQSRLPNLNSVVAWYRVPRNDAVASGSDYYPLSDSFTRPHAKLSKLHTP